MYPVFLTVVFVFAQQQAQQQAQRLNSAADARSARAQVFEALQESRSSDLSSMRASQPDGDTMAELPESLASVRVYCL